MKPDVVVVCVPTPLNKARDPDVSFIVQACGAIKDRLRCGQLVILESTTYPGTTHELVLPLLEESGLKVGRDFFLAFSPERVDPGNRVYTITNTPKVVGGITPVLHRNRHAFLSTIDRRSRTGLIDPGSRNDQVAGKYISQCEYRPCQ